jgi:hypothetical protein
MRGRFAALEPELESRRRSDPAAVFSFHRRRAASRPLAPPADLALAVSVRDQYLGLHVCWGLVVNGGVARALERQVIANCVRVLLTMAALTACSVPTSSGNTESNSTGSNDASNSTANAAGAEPSNWSYSENKDEMRGTESNEHFPGTFSFNGTLPTVLTVQKRPSGYEISISNHNLQFTCNSFSDTQVAVKFDTGSVARYGCTAAKGGTYGVAFILSERRFLQNLKKSKHVTVEAEVYQRGDVQMTFNTSGINL